jgi:hypothetical protein
MQDPEAEDHVETLARVLKRERVAAHILHSRPEQSADRAEALASLQHDPPARLHPGDVLLVVHGDHARRAPVFGQVGVEAVKRADV